MKELQCSQCPIFALWSKRSGLQMRGQECTCTSAFADIPSVSIVSSPASEGSRTTRASKCWRKGKKCLKLWLGQFFRLLQRWKVTELQDKLLASAAMKCFFHCRQVLWTTFSLETFSLACLYNIY